MDCSRRDSSAQRSDSDWRLAVGPTTFMGRLPNLIGAEACERLQNMAAGGGFRLLRESALYVDSPTAAS